MISGNLSINYGLKGPNFAIVTACTTGTHNIGDASRLIEYGDADVMVAGGIEAIFTALAIKDQVAPPTINIFNQDENCDLDYAANKAREMKINHAISNSFGFGGTNGSILLSKI